MSDELVRHTATLITKELAFIDPIADVTGILTLEDLKIRLIPFINYMIDKDMNRLLNMLYRIDVDESKVKHILTMEKPDLIGSRLTDLIVERQYQKVVTRNKYKNQK